MQAKPSPTPENPPAEPEKRERPLPRRRKIDTERLHTGMVWVVGWLILRRHRLKLRWVARQAGIGTQSLRDYLRFKHPDGWHTESRVALVLGRFPDELEHLTRRWMRKFRHRQQREHADEPGWRVIYPWEAPLPLCTAAAPAVKA